MSKLPFVPGNVMIDYTNHAGVRAVREIVPVASSFALHFGKTEWHPEEQWLLDAHDVAKDDLRTFAVKDIHAWAPKDTATGRAMESVYKQLQRSIEKNGRVAQRLQSEAMKRQLDAIGDQRIAVSIRANLERIKNDQEPI